MVKHTGVSCTVSALLSNYADTQYNTSVNTPQPLSSNNFIINKFCIA